MTKGCRKLYNEELHKLVLFTRHCWVIKSRIRWAWHVTCEGEVRNGYKIFEKNSEGKRQLATASSSLYNMIIIASVK